MAHVFRKRWKEVDSRLAKSFLQDVKGTARQRVALFRKLKAAGILDGAGNELTGLGIKQSLQLQSVLAAHERAQTFARARDLATEDEARQRFKTFLGSGSGYTASR